MLTILKAYFEQEVRSGRNIVRLEPENSQYLWEIIFSANPLKQVETQSKQTPSNPAPATIFSEVASLEANLQQQITAVDTQLKEEMEPNCGGSFLQEVSGSSKQEKFAKIKEIILLKGKTVGLEKCRNTVVFPVGNLDARLLFVGEAPGADEELLGEPFVGKAGELLTKMIAAMGLKREEVFICNVLLRRPSIGPVSDGPQAGNRPPTFEELKADRAQLMTFIDLVRPEVIVCLGLSAAKGLLLMSNTLMSQIRGKWFEIRDPIVAPVLVTYHPSYLLRNPSITEKRKVWEDLLKVMERLGLEITDKQRAYFTNKKNTS